MKKALILAGIYWNDPLQRHQQFTKYLVNMGYEVFFVEHIVSSKFTFSKVANKIFTNRTHNNIYNIYNQIYPNVQVINMHFVNPESGIFELYNQFQANKLIKKIGNYFDVIFNYLPINTTNYIINLIKYNKLIYDCVRDFENWGECVKTLQREEDKLIRCSSMIFTDSFYLTQKCKKKHKRVIQFLPVVTSEWINGCSYCNKITKIKKIGYFGSVDPHIDLKVFEKLVNQGYELHIWGVINVDIKMSYKNHGYQSNHELLAQEILKYCDAIILPYKGKMDGVIPAKIIQCLYTRLPVYISEFYDSIAMEKYLYIYRDTSILLEMIRNFNYEIHKEKLKIIQCFVEELNEEHQFEQFKKYLCD